MEDLIPKKEIRPNQYGYRFISEWSDFQGRTVKGIAKEYDSKEIIFSFTDGSYAYLYISSGYEGDIEVELHQNYTGLGYSNLFPSLLISIGLHTQEEVDERDKKAEELSRKVAEETDRATYERLKAKFGDV